MSTQLKPGESAIRVRQRSEPTERDFVQQIGRVNRERHRSGCRVEREIDIDDVGHVERAAI